VKTVKAKDRFDEPVTAAGLERAVLRGRKQSGTHLEATSVKYLPMFKSLLISFADESALVLPVKNYAELSTLSMAELKRLTLGFGGTALCLHERDLHLAIAGLISASEPLMEMAATVVASRNGSRSSVAKAQTSRENGLKGGRPRKLAVAG
jgi:hypothetical protein